MTAALFLIAWTIACASYGILVGWTIHSAYGWFIGRYGLRALIRYERLRRSGVQIDYSKVFTPEEIRLLEDRGLAPWKDS